MDTRRALVIVDVQWTFLPGGELGVGGSDAVIGALLAAVASDVYALVVASRDAHGPKHMSFVEQGGPWPAHGIDGTRGGELHPAIAGVAQVVIAKGRDDAVEEYSACAGRDDQDRSLIQILDEAGIDDVDVGGIATNFCVEATVLDLLKAGKRVRVLTFACRGIEVAPGAIRGSIKCMHEAGAQIIYDPAEL